MLTCDSVREILPGLAAGEAAPREVHAHLTTCAPCRGACERLTADLTQIRHDLAGLSASPFLESRVLEAIADASGPSKIARSPLRWGMLAGLAAAGLLAAVLILASREPEPGSVSETLPGEEEDGAATIPSQVEVPPTAAEVDFAGRARAGRGEVADRFYDVAGAPPPGLALLGKQLLDRLAADDRAEIMRRAHAHVWVLNPRSGAKAILLAQVSPRYTGTLLLEEPLARALGLHEHVLRGESTIAGDLNAKAYRARAHVRFATFDAEVEIQVRAAGEPPVAEVLPDVGLRRDVGVVFTGERPHMGFAGETVGIRHMHGEVFPMADHNVPWRKNALAHIGPRLGPGMLKKDGGPVYLPTQMMLEYRGDGLETCYVVLPAVDFGASAPLAWRMRMQRVNLQERFEPGAAVAVARVWRGATAIPSRESAAFTLADAKGRVSFVRTGGERGPLRMRERRKDGSVHWHRIDLESMEADLTPRLDVQLTKAGVIRIGARSFGPVPKKSRQFGWRWDLPEVAVLREHLAGLAERAGRSEPHRMAKLTMVLQAEAGTPWSAVEFVVLVCAHPDVRIDKLQFAGSGASVPYELPKDRGLEPVRSPDDMRPREAKLRMTRTSDGTYWRGFGVDKPRPLSTDGEWGHLLGRLRTYANASRASKAEPVLELQAWPNVPYAGVRRMIGAAQSAGIKDVRLMSSPPR